QQEEPGIDRAAAPDRDVPREGHDAKEPARDRRALRRARPYDGAARSAQDRGRTPEECRTEPAVARARADAEGMIRRDEIEHGCQATTLGTSFEQPCVCPQARTIRESCCRCACRNQTLRPHGLRVPK